MKCDIWRRTLPLGQSAGAASRLMNRQQPIHSHRERERNRGRRGQGWRERLRWIEKERGKKKETEKELLNAMEDSGWWEVRYSERRALSCVLCFVTGDPLREIEKAATLIRSESSCSPSLFFHLSVPPLHSASPLLF